ncbi:hypothetical protein GQR58_023135 [Nymphon striatum]|nr:hypothetical protein GQR58_023135 [Nymphon striatum]
MKQKQVKIFSGNKIPEGAEPIAMAYSGHQFGGFSPQLGDGRAILLGEVKDQDGTRHDLQLKGSGRTPWSRNGDGRSALGPVIREYLLSEAMHKLGVPTTRALAAVTTGEEVARQTLTPGGILTRVATGFVRVGTFQYFASQGQVDDLKKLAAYEIGRHYPQAKNSVSQAQNSDNQEVKKPYVAFLKEVVDAQARLIAKWMSIGFIHGVMNTDNMSIAGETIDYGPCAFMDEFSHDRVYSSIDTQGRYAYKNQPQIGQWNLVRFAETLLPLFADYVTPEQGKPEEVVVMFAQEVLNEYEGQYKHYWLNEMRQKLGLATTEFQLSPEKIFEQSLKKATDEGSSDSASQDSEENKQEVNIEDIAKANQRNADDHALISRLLDVMQAGNADFTLTFYHLSQDLVNLENARNLFENPDDFDAWAKKWQYRLSLEDSTAAEQQALMQRVNPVYIPRNHQVEAAIRAAEDHNDFSVFEALHAVLQSFTMLNWNDVLNNARNGNLAPNKRVEKTEAEWKSLLSDEEFRITRLHGTEMPHSSDMCTPQSAEINGDALEVIWNDENHHSKYDLDWLRHHDTNHTHSLNDSAQGHMKLWGNELQDSIPTFDYHELRNDDGTLLAWCEAIRDIGLAIVRGAPQQEREIERFADHVACVREVIYDRLHNVRATPGEYNAYNVASTSLELKPHTDMPNYNNPPGVQMFHFLVNETEGGMSTAVDGFHVAEQLKQQDPKAYETLTKIAVPFRMFSSRGDVYSANPLLTLDSSGALKVFRYSNQLAQTLNIPTEEMEAFYSAYRKLGRIVEAPENMVKFRLETGDMMATNNLRVMHGRTSYDASSGNRHLQLILYGL